MYKIAIIGERDCVMGYMAIGFSVHEAQDAAMAGRVLHKLAKSGEYAIIFIVENYAKALEEEIAAYKDSPLPAIIVIPGREGSLGIGKDNIQRAIERAVGADIL